MRSSTSPTVSPMRRRSHFGNPRHTPNVCHALADSGLETIFISRVRRRGVSIRQQIVIAGHAVDALIGERLVVQIDGYMFHSSAADRGRDVAHDAELVARGYTVLRFTYAQLIHDWPSVDRSIGRALAAGLHRAA